MSGELAGYDIETGALLKRQDFFKEVNEQAVRLQEIEPVKAALYEAIPTAYRDIPAYAALVNEYIANEPVKSASYRVNKWFCLHQLLLLDEDVRKQVGYTEKFDDPRVWLSWIERNLGDLNSPTYKIFKEAEKRQLQINRRQRASAVALGLSALNDPRRSGVEIKPQVVHEYGSAAGFVLGALSLRELNPVRLIGENGERDPLAEKWFNKGIVAFELERGVGVEINPPKDEKDERWLKSGTLSPSRLDRDNGEGSYEAHYDAIALVTPLLKNVETIEADILNLTAEQRTLLQNPRADAVFLSHILSQNLDQADEIIDIALSNLVRADY